MRPRNTEAALPQPEAAALEHSGRLREQIIAAIRDAGGALPFSQYMNLALYAPGLGYYSAGAKKFGPGGDFITAVDQGDFLARAIVTTVRPRLAACAEAVLLEVGAGTGALAADILRLLDAAGLRQVRYRILETSPDLRARQAERLAAWSARVRWIDSLEPGSVTGCIIANEVADALPADRVIRTANRWQQLAVACTHETLQWTVAPLSPPQQRAIDAICERLPEPLPEGFTTEIRLSLSAWIGSLGAAMRGGDILLIDYGLSRREYYHPQRSSGTLMCHYRHRAHGDPFIYPGLQDITAWVDFSDCADAARAAGLQVSGYTTQGGWIAATLQNEPDLIAGLSIEQAAQLRTLLLPGEMGERFKVLRLSQADDAEQTSALPGRDLRSRL